MSTKNFSESDDNSKKKSVTPPTGIIEIYLIARLHALQHLIK